MNIINLQEYLISSELNKHRSEIKNMLEQLNLFLKQERLLCLDEPELIEIATQLEYLLITTGDVDIKTAQYNSIL